MAIVSLDLPLTPGVDALGTAHDTRQSRAEDVYGLLKQDIACLLYTSPSPRD